MTVKLYWEQNGWNTPLTECAAIEKSSTIWSRNEAKLTIYSWWHNAVQLFQLFQETHRENPGVMFNISHINGLGRGYCSTMTFGVDFGRVRLGLSFKSWANRDTKIICFKEFAVFESRKAGPSPTILCLKKNCVRLTHFCHSDWL